MKRGSPAVILSFLLLISIFVIIAGFPKADAGTFPGSNGKIAFVSERDGNPEIYVMNADGTGQTNLSSSPTFDWNPSWSPDGTRIAFASERDGNFEIYVMNADGTKATRLTNDPSNDWWPSWSPDGSKITFVNDRDGDEIYVMNADGTEATRLTHSPSRDTQPDWGPLPPISGENALIADDGVISLGETTKLIQKIDASSGITGTLLSLRVLEADGDECAATGLPETIPASGILTKQYPTDFSLDTARGDGTCNTMQIGVYKAESEVEVGGVISKSTVEFSTNFFVIPESPVGAAALIGSSLAALGAYMKFKPKSS